MNRKLLSYFLVTGLSFSVFAQSKMVKIPSGSFNMGSPASERQRNMDEKQHSVSISSFYADAYEVTQKSFQSVMGKNPSVFKGDNFPVENVTWFDAIEYCNRLSEKEGLEKCYTVRGKDVAWNRAANGYRLLTEAEWEYACRAGTTTVFNTGNWNNPKDANYEGAISYRRKLRSPYKSECSGRAESWSHNRC